MGAALICRLVGHWWVLDGGARVFCWRCGTYPAELLQRGGAW